MKIINLQGENFKRMKAFDITPKGNTVVIAGKNGQGKTSILDSLVLALAGKSSEVAKLTTKPIREGEKTASVTVTTEDYIITRNWTEKDSYLEMTNKEGLAYKSPQALLDQMVGDLCFDPLEFSRMKGKEQREALLGIVKLDIDLDQFERDYKLQYDQRTSVGAQGKSLQGKSDTTPEVPVDTPDVEINMTALVKELDDVKTQYAEANLLVDQVQANKQRVAALQEELQMAEASLAAFEQDLAKCVDRGELAKSIESLAATFATAEATNNNVRLKRQKAQAAAEAEKYTVEYARITGELETMQATKAAKLAAAQFPIAGLAFTDDGVTYKNIPFAQCSAAEQLKVSMAIAMAKNPKLRVIRITDGSLLDDDNMKVLEEMADKNDFQVWIEKVSSDGKVGIVIQEGEVYKDNYEPTSEKA